MKAFIVVVFALFSCFAVQFAFADSSNVQPFVSESTVECCTTTLSNSKFGFYTDHRTWGRGSDNVDCPAGEVLTNIREWGAVADAGEMDGATCVKPVTTCKLVPASEWTADKCDGSPPVKQ